MLRLHLIGVVLLGFISSIALADSPPAVSIVADPNPAAPNTHGVDAIQSALSAKKLSVEVVHSIADAHGKTLLIAGVASTDGPAAAILKSQNISVPAPPESLVVRHIKLDDGRPALLLAGADARGLMYAQLDTADRIGWSDANDDPFREVKDITESADAPHRAVSMYTMQRAYFEQRLYDEHYWQKYFDTLARDRFDSFVLIFGYENGGFCAPPYPYFFDVDGFPDVKMVGITPEQQQKNLTSLNRLIAIAHDHGIDVTIGIWDHIYRGGVQANGVPGTEDALKKPTQGLVWGVTADNLVPYTKAALTKFLREVHGIDAIQFRMHDESGLKNSEQAGFWSEIARLMQKEAPNIRFDARAKGLPDAVIDDIVSTGIPFRVDTKYWMEQMAMPWHPTHINEQDQDNRRHSYADLLRYPQRYKMHWRIWNGGTERVLLWGDPDYVKRIVETTHLYDGDGFEINEPLCTKMQGQAQDVKPFDLLKPEYKYTEYEFERYWYQLMLFGRLGYDPKMSSEVWDREFERRFGKDAAPHAENAVNHASWILPRIVGALYPYSAFPMTRGWAERQPFGDLATYAKNQGSDVAIFANFEEETSSILGEAESAKVLPSQTARWLSACADQLIFELPYLASDKPNPETLSTTVDLLCLARLAQFHAARTRAALAWCLYQRTHDRAALDLAVRQERLANQHWHDLSRFANQYNENLMFGNPKAGLAGNWKDELAGLDQSLADLQKELKDVAKTSNAANTGPVSILSERFESFSTPPKVQSEVVDRMKVGATLKISATVTSSNGIKWVRLRCRPVNQRLDYDSIPMTLTGKPDEYQAIVPPEKIPPQFDFMYYIEAMDKSGSGCIWPDFEKQTPYVIVKLDRAASGAAPAMRGPGADKSNDK